MSEETVLVVPDIGPVQLHHVTYAAAKFEIAMSNGLKMHLQEHTLFDR